jgi:6-phosphogluconolactonase
MPDVQVLPDAASVARVAAETVAEALSNAAERRGRCSIALSGGSTPRDLYQRLGSVGYVERVPWDALHVFWGDERCVPPDDKESNYGMADRTLLSRLDLRPDQVHRMRGELPPAEGARAYQEVLKAAFSLADGEAPRLDLVMLGLGDNRHTLSLFPGHKRAIEETERLVVADEVEAVPPKRITFTPLVANHAARAMFVATGKGKAEAVRDIIAGPRDPLKFPAQIIQPTDGELLWLLDKAAASLLPNR